MMGFLFGKLPAFGDFVSRGLTISMRSWWDNWCCAAMLETECEVAESFDLHCRATPPRRFLIAPPAKGGAWQAGCVIPSNDRAGRAFPFVLGVSSCNPIEVTDGADIGERIAACVGNAFEQRVDLDALLTAAEVAAGSKSYATRPIHPTIFLETGWIGENPHSVEV